LDIVSRNDRKRDAIIPKIIVDKIPQNIKRQNFNMQPSGIRDNVVPVSRRPDGTLRKAIKIRPGFVPQEDQKPFVAARIQGIALP
jgi:hypothetical protein